MNDHTGFLDIFPRSELFADIEEGKLPDVHSYGRQCAYEPGVALFREGDPADKSFFVLKGRIKLTKLHPEGRETIVRYINPGEMTAAVSVFRERNYPVTAEAIETSEVIAFDRETMLEVMRAYPQVAINLLGIVVERLENVQSRYLEMQVERVEQRIARSLLRIMKQSGRKTDEGILIDFRLSRKDLADYTGTTLYTVSRILSSWEQRGWIATGRERIIVSDPHSLVAFAETG